MALLCAWVIDCQANFILVGSVKWLCWWWLWWIVEVNFGFSGTVSRRDYFEGDGQGHG